MLHILSTFVSTTEFEGWYHILQDLQDNERFKILYHGYNFPVFGPFGLEKAYVEFRAPRNQYNERAWMTSQKLNQDGRQQLLYQLVGPMVTTSLYDNFDSACYTFLQAPLSKGKHRTSACTWTTRV